MSDESGQLIEADFTTGGATYKLARSGYCGHRHHRDVDPDKRTVTCRGCGAQLDPFQCLLDVANAGDRREQKLKELLRMTEAAEARLEELLRQERNARARVRRLGE